MGPLEGIRALNLSKYGPGRYCSMILGDLCAEAIVVEMPKGASSCNCLKVWLHYLRHPADISIVPELVHGTFSLATTVSQRFYSYINTNLISI